MSKKETRTAVCPLCGQTYTGVPAMSRTDNKTAVCPDCGVRQALESIDLGKDEQDAILAIIHRSVAGKS